MAGTLEDGPQGSDAHHAELMFLRGQEGLLGALWAHEASGLAMQLPLVPTAYQIGPFQQTRVPQATAAPGLSRAPVPTAHRPLPGQPRRGRLGSRKGVGHTKPPGSTEQTWARGCFPPQLPSGASQLRGYSCPCAPFSPLRP